MKISIIISPYYWGLGFAVFYDNEIGKGIDFFVGCIRITFAQEERNS